jgi:hypothetical protein
MRRDSTRFKDRHVRTWLTAALALISIEHEAHAATVTVGGAQLGTLLTATELCFQVAGGLWGAGCNSGVGVAVVSAQVSTGFIVYVNTGAILTDGRSAGVEGTPFVPANVYFDGANCTGNKYLDGQYVTPFFLRQGLVFGAIDPADVNPTYYVQGSPSGATIVSYQTAVAASSGALSTPQCANVSVSRWPLFALPSDAFYALTPNNPGVTGTPMSLSGAITITAN